MSALSWDTANHLTVPRLDQDCQEELTSGPRTLPNGQRISGERRAEGDERVRCMRVLGGAFLFRRSDHEIEGPRYQFVCAHTRASENNAD